MTDFTGGAAGRPVRWRVRRKAGGVEDGVCHRAAIAAEGSRQMSRWGWRALVFLSLLSAISAFKFIPDGLSRGLVPSLAEGVVPAWWAFVEEGIRGGADHVAHHLDNVGGTLAVHMIFGGLAVLLIPLQVGRMWRSGTALRHARLGWALVPIVSVAALTTPPIAFNMDYPMWSEIGFALGSVLWFGALVMGIYWIRQGDRDRHRRWMVMMAALCFGAVSFRLQLPVLRVFFDLEYVFPYLGWSCWVPNVIVVAWWWRRDMQRLGQLTPAAAGAHSAMTPAE